MEATEKNEYDLCTYIKRRHKILTWKTQTREKNHGNSQTPNCPLKDRRYNQRLGGNNLKLYVFTNRRLQQIHLCLSLSAPFRALYMHYITIHDNNYMLTYTNSFCPSCIYTYSLKRHIGTYLQICLIFRFTLYSVGFLLQACPVPIQRN